MPNYKHIINILLILSMLLISCEEKMEAPPVKVSFYDGDMHLGTITVQAGAESRLIANPTKEDFDFIGWELNGELIPKTDEYFIFPQSETSFRLNAVWQQKKISIVFYSDGNEYERIDNYTPNEEIAMPAIPDKHGYIFSGWLLDGSLISPEEEIICHEYRENGYRYDAKWEAKEMTAIFINDGEIYKSVVVKADDELTLPEPPEKHGYSFSGWLLDDEPLDCASPLLLPYKQEGYEIHASYRKKPMTLTFCSEGVIYVTYTDVLADEPFIFPSPERHGFELTGWMLGEEFYDISDPDLKPSLLYNESGYIFDAVWERKKMTIRLFTKEGSYRTLVDSFDVVEDEEYEIPDFSKPGYIVTWCDDFTKEPLDITNNKHSSKYKEGGYDYLGTFEAYLEVSNEGLVKKGPAIGRITDLEIPSKIGIVEVTGIENFGFNNCTTITSVTVPSFISDIPYHAFAGCSSLESVVVENGPNSIGDYAFVDCGKLKSVTIANSVQQIKEAAFKNCLNLEKVSLSGDIRAFVYALDDKIFPQDASFTLIINAGSEALTSELGAEVKNSVHSLILPDSLLAIEESAFEDSTKLNEVTFGSNLESIGERAFKNCSISSIELPDGLVDIGEMAFYRCNIDELELKSLASMGDSAFKLCTKLESVVLPDNLFSVPTSAFEECTSLKSLSLGKNVEEIGTNAFKNCSELDAIILPGTTKKIGNFAFSNLDSIKSLTIPASLTELGDQAFSGCDMLETIRIEDGEMLEIGNSSFTKCTSLSDVYIGKGVTALDNFSFASCSQLRHVTIAESVSEISSSAFDGCGNIALDFTEGTEVVKSAISAFKDSITSVLIPNSVTAIEEKAFRACSALKEIIIPESVKTIGENAFALCDLLENIYIKNTENSITGEKWGAVNATVEWDYID